MQCPWYLWYFQLHACLPGRAQHPDDPFPCRRCRCVRVLVQCNAVLCYSSLVRETTETESQNYGYKFGQEETYNIVPGYWSHLPIPLQQLPFAALFLAAWLFGIRFTDLVLAPWHSTSMVSTSTSPSWMVMQSLNTWGDVLNRAGLGMEVTDERNAQNFPLDLAAAESPCCYRT